MTGGPNRSLEDLLHDRLHEMDAVDPPEPDFEFRALRTGRERLKRRQTWTRGLVGAAAAVVIGALAIPSLGRLGTSGGGVATSGAGDAGTAASAPEAAPGGAGQDLKGPGSLPPDGMSLDNVPDSLRVTFAQVRTVLSAPPYDGVFTSLTFDPSTPPNGRVFLHLTRPDQRAIDVVQSAFATGPEVVVETSAYSLAACNQTWAKLAADPQLRPETVTLVILGCDANGRVAVRVTADAPATAVDRLTAYGDALSVVGP